MHNLPPLKEYFIAGAIILFSLSLGIIFKRIIVQWLIRVTAKTSWKGDEVIVHASKGVFIFLFFLAGMYAAALYMPGFGVVKKEVVYLILNILAVFCLTLIISRIITGWIALYQESTDSPLVKSTILNYIIKSIIFVIGILIILQILKIPITPLLTALGVGGLAVALALQPTLSNLFAGIQILAAKNLHPGDYVRLESGDDGYIVDINWRSTTIRALSNKIIIIPNSRLADSVINNFSKPEEELSILVGIGISYSSDLEKVERVTVEVARETMAANEGAVQGFEPFIRYNKFDAYSINFNVILRVRTFVDQFLLQHEFIKKLHARYLQEGIEIPFPITTIVKADTTSK
ncbi:MAG TPA: mechanosensitive ion channel family protein [Bacteroidales bacterium]|nr:mechanosensitive ion channel family protein [Bacteroidales bacterium]